MVGTPEWVNNTPCLDKAQFMWYPPVDANDPQQWYEMGRLVCSTCPVWEECLNYGTSYKDGKGEKFGMWGGLTPVERRRSSKTHGQWVDYRRGCRCDECTEAHEEQMLEEPIDLSLLPDKETPVYDTPGRFLFDMS